MWADLVISHGSACEQQDTTTDNDKNYEEDVTSTYCVVSVLQKYKIAKTVLRDTALHPMYTLPNYQNSATHREELYLCFNFFDSTNRLTNHF